MNTLSENFLETWTCVSWISHKQLAQSEGRKWTLCYLAALNCEDKRALRLTTTQ